MVDADDELRAVQRPRLGVRGDVLPDHTRPAGDDLTEGPHPKKPLAGEILVE
jgi:hypothetical protein